MRGKVALLGFLALQAVVIAIWLMSLLPLTRRDAPPFISDSAQIWSGGAEAIMSENWRARSTTEVAAPFKPSGPLLTATLLMVVSIIGAIVAPVFLHQRKVWLAAGAVVATLVLGAGAAWFIVQQWNSSTMFPPGYANTGWLYMSTRALLMQMLLGYVLLVVFLGLVIADIAKPERPLGFAYAAANWGIVVVVWSVMYLALFLVPIMGSGG